MKLQFNCKYKLGQKLYSKDKRKPFVVAGIELSMTGIVYIRVMGEKCGSQATWSEDLIPQEFLTENPDDIAFRKFMDEHHDIDDLAREAWDAALRYERGGK